ncbi:hypothetical protein ACGF0J_21655 [Nonomuraea sp. NPDC047897]|uniref:hypothetical protein n=1 Tax=Nonomuraea sp. NPDC047897 TaxID=3364346 RepID=UPI0037155A91
MTRDPKTPTYGSPEYWTARAAAIERIVAEAPPLTSEQIVKLRRIFASTAPKGSKVVRPINEAA